MESKQEAFALDIFLVTSGNNSGTSDGQICICSPEISASPAIKRSPLVIWGYLTGGNCRYALPSPLLLLWPLQFLVWWQQQKCSGMALAMPFQEPRYMALWEVPCWLSNGSQEFLGKKLIPPSAMAFGILSSLSMTVMEQVGKLQRQEAEGGRLR